MHIASILRTIFCRKCIMRKLFVCVLFIPILLVSCATRPIPSSQIPPESIVAQPVPAIPVSIQGTGLISSEHLAGFLSESNPALSKVQASELAAIYIEEAQIEGINSDVAFSQMCLETGFLRFGGLVTPDMNNFCGLGAIGPEQPGEKFPNPQTGVRAHIQHLKGYASTDPLNRPLVDPRYKWVKYGTAPMIQDLTGKWASDKEYGNKISRILERLYEYSISEDKI
jgi:hypothetical protein